MYSEIVLHCVNKERLGKTCVLPHKLHNLPVVFHLFLNTKINKIICKDSDRTGQ